MSSIEWIGLTLAFLGPMPAPRPEKPERPAGAEWVMALVVGTVCLTMVLPMITIWTFHRPDEGIRARCRASNGHIAYASLDGSGPLRCDRGTPR